MYIRTHEGLGQDPTPSSLDIEFEAFLKTVDKQNFVKVLEGLRNTLNSWLGDYGPSLGQIIIRRALQFLDMAYISAYSDISAYSEPNSSDRNRSVGSIKTAFEILGFLKVILVVEVTLKTLLSFAMLATIPAGVPSKLLSLASGFVFVAKLLAQSKKLKEILTSLSTLLTAVTTLDKLKRAQAFYVANRQTIVTLSNPPP
jgi:hypothetical protein